MSTALKSTALKSTALKSTSRLRSPSPQRPPLYPVPAPKQPARSRQGAKPKLSAVPVLKPGAEVSRFPIDRSMPLWLRLLIRLQHGSRVVAFILVTATLIVYGSTVYTQQLWSKQYRDLKLLQRNERSMVAATEIGKDNLARQAERSGSGLVPQTPANTIFLQPAPQRFVPTVVDSNRPKPEPASDKPLGY